MISYWKISRTGKMGIRNAQSRYHNMPAKLTLWMGQRGRAKQLPKVIPLITAFWDAPKAWIGLILIS